jgi:hypothetical protein
MLAPGTALGPYQILAQPTSAGPAQKEEKVTSDRMRLSAQGCVAHHLAVACALPILALLILCLAAGAFAATVTPLTDAQRAWLSKADRHEKASWVYAHIEGAPRERGFQYGYLLAPEIARGIKAARRNWEYQSAMPWTWLQGKAETMFTRLIDQESLAELDGIVEGLHAAGVPSSRAEIITYNGWIELNGYWWPQERKKLKEAKTPPPRQSCSAFIATGSMTVDGGVVLGHNTFIGYQDVLPNVILDVVPDKGHRILMQTNAGWIHSGTDFFITDAGLVGSETTIGGFDGFDPKGVPEFVRMRRATQDAGSIDEWCSIMKRGNNGGYANAWLLGDVNTGEIARLELGLKYVGFEKKRDGYFTGSNVAEDLKILRFETDAHETDIRKSSVARRLRWEQLMMQYAGKIDLEVAKRMEADHFDVYLGAERPGERSLCGHFELERVPASPWPYIPNEPAGALDAKVVDSRMARRMSIAARWGAPCGMAFDAQQFLKDHPQFEWMKGVLESRPSEPWTEFTAGEPK